VIHGRIDRSGGGSGDGGKIVGHRGISFFDRASVSETPMKPGDDSKV
jgi:hypothetical protein